MSTDVDFETTHSHTPASGRRNDRFGSLRNCCGDASAQLPITVDEDFNFQPLPPRAARENVGAQERFIIALGIAATAVLIDDPPLAPVLDNRNGSRRQRTSPFAFEDRRFAHRVTAGLVLPTNTQGPAIQSVATASVRYRTKAKLRWRAFASPAHGAYHRPIVRSVLWARTARSRFALLPPLREEQWRPTRFAIDF
jgi:hypothetical protein